MYHLVQNLRTIAILIKPFMPETSNKMLNQLGIKDEEFMTWESLENYKQLPSDVRVIEKGEPLFMRLDRDEEIEYIRNEMKK